MGAPLAGGEFRGGFPINAPPSVVPTASSPSQVDKEDLGYFAFSSTSLPLFVILNSFQDNMRRLFVILKQVQDDGLVSG